MLQLCQYLDILELCIKLGFELKKKPIGHASNQTTRKHCPSSSGEAASAFSNSNTAWKSCQTGPRTSNRRQSMRNGSLSQTAVALCQDSVDCYTMAGPTVSAVDSCLQSSHSLSSTHITMGLYKCILQSQWYSSVLHWYLLTSLFHVEFDLC